MLGYIWNKTERLHEKKRRPEFVKIPDDASGVSGMTKQAAARA